MKKILIVTHWFYPRNVPRAFRAWELVRELRRKNVKVDIVIGDYKIFVKDEDFNEDQFKNIEVNTSKYKNISNNRIFSAFKNMLMYFIGDRYFFKSGVFLFKNIDMIKYDSIISIGLPFYVNFVSALKISKSKSINCVTIGEWSDPFYGIEDNRVAVYFKSIQKMICNRFDYTIVPTVKAVDYFKEYVDIGKIKVIPQGFNFSNIGLAKYKENDVIKFAYAGIFYLDIRNPEKFLQFLSTLEFDFVFVIYTITHGPVYTEVLEKYKKVLKNKLEIHDLIPREKVIKELSKMDFLINIENNSQNQIPSKLIDYAITKRPIFSFTPNNVPEKEFLKFMERDYSNSLSINLDDYNIDKVSEQFMELFESRNN